jgi:membrane glycosyltransferase
VSDESGPASGEEPPQRSVRLTLAEAASIESRAVEDLLLADQAKHRGEAQPFTLPAAVVRYADALTLDPGARAALLEETGKRIGDGTSDTRQALLALHRALAGREVDPEDPAAATRHRRLELALSGSTAGALTDAHDRLLTSPPLARSPMVPSAWSGGGLWGRWLGPRRHDAVGDGPDGPGHWQRSGHFRRVVLLGLTLAQTYIATSFMVAVLPYHGRQWLEVGMICLFAILFAWVSGGFWTAMAGYALLLARSDRFAISRTAPPGAAVDPDARVAVVMPIRNENVARVFAGLRATYESVARYGGLAHFDFFVLSDTSDPAARVAEVAAWQATCRAVGGFGKLFYRWRRHRIKRKSGNIADFCRRWGRNYRYMVILDADSVMSGACLMRLLRLMEANPGAGIIQTAPHAAGRETLYARMQQFATRVYGPLFTAGLHFWQLGESHYWGHNAMIRVAPFMRHCALRRLPGRGRLSGEILSHDFVEAALMRRAGWAVWIAYDLLGSYEEMPPSLIDELQRDRRWCQGNLMNFRLLLMKGLHIAHRAVFMSGVMAYLAAPLWLLFLILSTALLAVHTLTAPTYFIAPYQLFPLWPEWHPEWAVMLLGATALLLLLPKLLGVLVIATRSPRSYGGTSRIVASLFAEFALSVLLAPTRMLSHTRFVLAALAGWRVHWKSPPRVDADTSWRESISRHGWHTLIGAAWAAGVYWLNPSVVLWLLPVAGALVLSIPVSVYTSRSSLGRRARKAGFFFIPEELRPPPEIRATAAYLRAAAPAPDFVGAVVDPLLNAIVCGAGVVRARGTELSRKERRILVRKALEDGASALGEAQRMRILDDPVALSQLHAAVWAGDGAHGEWRAAVGA